ncbi:Uu.00g044390.m01.CDS01 [Anthostomella pinea]|uniref:Uu.00g044390.m01.CDS01 n=1 Tax=Anthostomella pinea TaxID=933095 RepID=A0AAI8YE79_9PEZI|nr:Uu.00g044390.m01.CDS01 [Anthostomella pinea]
MASHNQQQQRTPTASELHHALLRPAILQILRAQGYYSSTPGVVDCVTELAGNYLSAIARQTALHAAANNELTATPGVADVRMALEDCGALWPERDFVAQELSGEEDTRGVDEFVRWVTGKKNQRIRKIAGLGAPQVVAAEEGVVEEERPTDYLDALKRKHNKTDVDSRYAGTILGRGIDHGEVLVEGGNESSLLDWARKMFEASQRPPEPEVDLDPRPPSSGLSSLTDGDVEMMDFD